VNQRIGWATKSVVRSGRWIASDFGAISPRVMVEDGDDDEGGGQARGVGQGRLGIGKADEERLEEMAKAGSPTQRAEARQVMPTWQEER